jgi:diacylglycerol kinase family enzyme
VLVNRGGGAAAGDAGERLAALFAAKGVEADIRLVAPGDLPDAFAQAARAEGYDAVVAAGGDGTVGTAAAALAGTGRPLGILPLGTLNHFARDAGIPLDLEGAVAAIAAAAAKAVDVAEVNGRVFVNNSVVGLYPLMVREREAQQRRLGRSKRLAMLVASLRALYRFSHRRLTINIAGRQAPIETPLLFVGNNRYQIGLLTLGRREAIDRGELSLYAPLARTALQFLGIALRAIVGRADRQKDFVNLEGIEAAQIHSARPSLIVATDGEAHIVETPLRYLIRPGALRLIVPEEAAAR